MHSRRDQLKPCAYSPLGIVFMGLRIAEVHKHAVAHVLCDEAAGALHSVRNALLDRPK